MLTDKSLITALLCQGGSLPSEYLLFNHGHQQTSGKRSSVFETYPLSPTLSLVSFDAS